MLKRYKNFVLCTLAIAFTIVIAVTMIHVTLSDIRAESAKTAAQLALVKEKERKWELMRPARESLLKALDEVNEALGAMLDESRRTPIIFIERGL